MFSRGRMSESQRLDILEYLAFQTKTGASYRNSIARYIEAERPRRVVDACIEAMEAIETGTKPADALLSAGIVNKAEYTLVSNAQNNFEVVSIVVAQGRELSKSSDALRGAFKYGILGVSFLLLLIPYFKDSIVGIYVMFANMSGLASGKKVEPQIPFLVKYWWSAFVAIGAIGAIYFLVTLFLRWVYQYHGKIYYRIFGYTIYRDLISIISSLQQMGKVMSWSQAYTTLSNNAPNSYWSELFDGVAENLKNGGKASEIIAFQRGVIPVEVVHCFVDGESTGEVDVYLAKAALYCQTKFDKSQEIIRTVTPIVFDLLMYFMVGLVVVKFTSDMNELGIMQVITQMR